MKKLNKPVQYQIVIQPPRRTSWPAAVGVSPQNALKPPIRTTRSMLIFANLRPVIDRSFFISTLFLMPPKKDESEEGGSLVQVQAVHMCKLFRLFTVYALLRTGRTVNSSKMFNTISSKLPIS
jgi:hypothetical protein